MQTNNQCKLCGARVLFVIDERCSSVPLEKTEINIYTRSTGPGASVWQKVAGFRDHYDVCPHSMRQVQQEGQVMKPVEASNQILTAAVNRVTRAALEMLGSDRHEFSTRPCPTCRAISELLGSPWGCSEMAQ